VSGSEISYCELDCDICSCQAYKPERVVGQDNWTSTGAALTLNLLGSEETYDYCVSADQLRLSAKGLYFEFERVETYGRPRRCSERDASECILGTGCVLETAGCAGDAPDECTPADFDLVPGCGFVDGPLRCGGVQLSCENRAELYCNDGCATMTDGSCTGTPASCSGHTVEECESTFGCWLEPAE
jgi:hypothetical protein